MNQDTEFAQWAVLELFGYTRLAGRVTECTIGASSFIRVDIPDEKGDILHSKFYNPTAIYSISPVSKEVAIKVAARQALPPVQPWELKQLPSPDGGEECAASGEEK